MLDPDETGAYPHGSKGRPSVKSAFAVPLYIGRYRVEKVLGQGGFGVVYLAHDAQLQRLVAIKVPHSNRVASADDAEPYLIEARTVAGLDHTNIVPVYDVGSTEGFPFFIVSKYINGTDLATRLRQSRLSQYESVELVATIADALHHAHKQGLVHRDIKPGNILLDKQGKPFVADFGMALREEDVGKGARYGGTPSYMSPEQARGEGHLVDGRSDIFSLGVVLFESLTGRCPFRGDSLQDLLEKIIHVDPRPPRQIDDRIPIELERICLKSISKRASERYSAARDLADDLRHYLDSAKQATPKAQHSIAQNTAGIHTREIGLSNQRAIVARSTFLIADFKGFTERVRILEQAAGHQAAAEMKRRVSRYIEEALRQLEEEIKPDNYQLIDTAGDSFFFHFRSAKDAFRLAETLRQLAEAHNSQQPDKLAEHNFRIGAATGDVAWDEGKPVGHTVNVCSRMHSASTGDDFVIDTATYLALPFEIQVRFGPKEVIRDKNDQTYDVHRVVFGPCLAPSSTPVAEDLTERPTMPASMGGRNTTGTKSDLVPATQQFPEVKRIRNRRRWHLLAAVGLCFAIVWIAFEAMFGRALEGIIEIRNLDPEAEVYIDGRQSEVKWTENMTLAEVAVRPGVRKLELKLDGITTYESNIEIVGSSRNIVAISLQDADSANVERLLSAEKAPSSPKLTLDNLAPLADDGYTLITGRGNWNNWYKLRFPNRSTWIFGDIEMSMDYKREYLSDNSVWATKRSDYSDYYFKFDIKINGSGALFGFRDQEQIRTGNPAYPVTKGQGYCVLLLGGIATSQPPWAGRQTGGLYVMGGGPVPYGKIQLLSAPGSVTWNKTEWNRVEGCVIGDKINIALNGNNIIDFTDEKSLFKQGMFSFTPIHLESKVAVRNFAVKIVADGSKSSK